MGIDFGALIVDLETLVCSSKEDFFNEFWASYETYTKTYNKLLKDLQTLGFFKEVKFMFLLVTKHLILELLNKKKQN